jgi:hypothetical protein
MRKLLLGIGLMAVGRILSRGQPAGLARFVSLRWLAAVIAGAAATELLTRHQSGPPPASG